MNDRRSRSLFVNALTVSRVPLIVAFMLIAIVSRLLGDGHHLALEVTAGVCMFLSGITDLFDGMLARKWKVVSTFGKMADPLMDKVFFIVVFPTLTWLAADIGDRVQTLALLFFTVLYILRDQWVTFLRSVGTYFQADVGALYLGKVRTALSFPTAGLIYAALVLPHHVGIELSTNLCLQIIVYSTEAAMMILNIWSVVYYTKHYMPYISKAIHPEKN